MKISFVTCVNDFELYEKCVVSSIEKRAVSHEIELIPIDNTTSKYSAPQALNLGLDKGKGEIIVYCHQDVVFPPNWLEMLQDQIAKVDELQEEWGVLGTFGISLKGRYVGNVCDPHNNMPSIDLPCQVQSLDEHCLIIRRDSGLSFDENLAGFHCYGTDLCLQAMAKRMNNYAIDARLTHLSPGNKDSSFYEMAGLLEKKWQSIRNNRYIIKTPLGYFRLKKGLLARLICLYIRLRWKPGWHIKIWQK